jgi:hypothetical protein
MKFINTDIKYQPSLTKKKEKVAHNAAVSCDRLKKKRTKARQPKLCSACTIVTISPDKNTLVGCVKCTEYAFLRLLCVSNQSTWREKGWENNILCESLSHVDYYCGGPLLEDYHPMVTMLGKQQELVCFKNIGTQYYTQLAKLNPPEYFEKTCISCAACAADEVVDDYVRDARAIYEGITPVCIKCKDLEFMATAKSRKELKEYWRKSIIVRNKMGLVMKRWTVPHKQQYVHHAKEAKNQLKMHG